VRGLRGCADMLSGRLRAIHDPQENTA
jgi:hypothetical protein